MGLLIPWRAMARAVVTNHSRRTYQMIRTLRVALLAAVVSAACGAAAQASGQLPVGHPAIFNDAFTTGYSMTVGEVRATFESTLLGMFKLPSGWFVACDPFMCDLALPFLKQVPAGEFPLYLAIVRWDGAWRVAFAKLAFSEAPVVRWEMALVEGADPARQRPGHLFGYGVDSGIGSFMDAETWRSFIARMDAEGERFSDFLFQELQRAEMDGRRGLLMSSGPGSVAIFSSGFGDGWYATYWGYDARGNLAAALTDFYVVPWAHPNGSP